MPELPGEDGTRASAQIHVGRELQPVKGSMPMTVDEVEGARFAVNVASLARDAGLDDEWPITRWSCEVTFSLSEFTDSERRVIVYSNPEMDPRLHRLKEARELGFD